MAVADLDLLNELVRLFDDLHAQTHPFVDPVLNSNSSAIPTSSLIKSSLHFKLPTQSETLSLFSSAGASRELAKELSTIHCERAYDLANKYSVIYDQNWNEISQPAYCTTQVHLSKLAVHLETKFHKIEQNWRQEVLTSISPSRQKRKVNQPGSFNQNFVPCLETFFKENPRPSRADKLLLSRKSGMSFRQVSVWFQNRRRRSKKQDSPTAVCDYGPPVSIAGWAGNVYSEENQARNIESDKGSDGSKCMSETSSRASSVTLVNDSFDTFASTPPPSAFPMPYPPGPAEYPFPCQRGDLSMPIPQWRRRPINRPIARFAQGDISNVIETFARLSLEDETPVKNELVVPCDVMAPYTVRPLPAPLSSLFTTAQTTSPRPHVELFSPESVSDQEDDAPSSSSPSSPESSGPSTPYARPQAKLSNSPSPALLTESRVPAVWCTSNLFLEDPLDSIFSLDVTLPDSLTLDRAGLLDLQISKAGADESTFFWDPEFLSQFPNY